MTIRNIPSHPKQHIICFGVCGSVECIDIIMYPQPSPPVQMMKCQHNSANCTWNVDPLPLYSPIANKPWLCSIRHVRLMVNEIEWYTWWKLVQLVANVDSWRRDVLCRRWRRSIWDEIPAIEDGVDVVSGRRGWIDLPYRPHHMMPRRCTFSCCQTIAWTFARMTTSCFGKSGIEKTIDSIRVTGDIASMSRCQVKVQRKRNELGMMMFGRPWWWMTGWWVMFGVVRH